MSSTPTPDPSPPVPDHNNDISLIINEHGQPVYAALHPVDPIQAQQIQSALQEHAELLSLLRQERELISAIRQQRRNGTGARVRGRPTEAQDQTVGPNAVQDEVRRVTLQSLVLTIVLTIFLFLVWKYDLGYRAKPEPEPEPAVVENDSSFILFTIIFSVVFLLTFRELLIRLVRLAVVDSPWRNRLVRLIAGELELPWGFSVIVVVLNILHFYLWYYRPIEPVELGSFLEAILSLYILHVYLVLFRHVGLVAVDFGWINVVQLVLSLPEWLSRRIIRNFIAEE